MESCKDETQEIFFGFGKCTLKELANRYRDNNELLPNSLILLIFKTVAELMLMFYEKGYFYTDTKPENLVLKSDEV